MPLTTLKMKTPVGNVILFAVAFLFGLYEMVYGFYAWRLNGFKFYITAGFLIGSPFLAVGTTLILQPPQTHLSWELLIGLVWVFGVAWKSWRKRIARRNHPMEWEKWEAILHGQ